MIAKVKKSSTKATPKKAIKKTGVKSSPKAAKTPTPSPKASKLEYKSSLHRMLTAEGWKRAMKND